jgi:glycerophosphoryl diester phosphodiesterase
MSFIKLLIIYFKLYMKKKAFLFLVLILGLFLVRFSYPLIYQLFISTNRSHNFVLPKVIAHRGASGYAPENTLTAFSKALSLQVDIIEFDVHLTNDGEIIVLHDSDLERTTNRTGEVSGYTLAELQQLDAGSWHTPAFKDERLPTLRQVLQLVNGQTTCIIELKWGTEGYYPELAQKVVAEVERINGESWCIVQSYEGRYLEEINQLNPKIKLVKAMIGVWSGLPPGFYYDTGFHWGNYQIPDYLWGINVYYKTITKAQIKYWHSQNLIVWTYTIDDPSQLSKQINMGVDGLITNYPDRLQEILQENK